MGIWRHAESLSMGGIRELSGISAGFEDRVEAHVLMGDNILPVRYCTYVHLLLSPVGMARCRVCRKTIQGRGLVSSSPSLLVNFRGSGACNFPGAYYSWYSDRASLAPICGRRSRYWSQQSHPSDVIPATWVSAERAGGGGGAPPPPREVPATSLGIRDHTARKELHSQRHLVTDHHCGIYPRSDSPSDAVVSSSSSSSC